MNVVYYIHASRNIIVEFGPSLTQLRRSTRRHNRIIKKILLFIIILAIEHYVISTLSRQKSLPCSDKGKEHLLHIMIVSAAGNRVRRQNIRDTWVNEVNNRSSYIGYNFFIGTKNMISTDHEILSQEQAEYRDIIFLSEIEDKHKQRTYKALEILKWVHGNTNAAYYFRVEDDCYLSVYRIVKILASEGLPREKLLMGNLMGSSAVRGAGKWADFGWKMCGVYLPYARDTGYLLTQDLVAFIATNSDRLEIYPNEDTTVGAWIAGLNVTYQHDARAYSDGSACREDGYLFHDYPKNSLNRIHKLWMTQGRTCGEI